uniref:Uncharacterized protein n=2 Tax=Brassica oleracea TaxID=3712 RepID=A0A0D2ZY85_BRAOL
MVAVLGMEQWISVNQVVQVMQLNLRITKHCIWRHKQSSSKLPISVMSCLLKLKMLSIGVLSCETCSLIMSHPLKLQDKLQPLITPSKP